MITITVTVDPAGCAGGVTVTLESSLIVNALAGALPNSTAMASFKPLPIISIGLALVPLLFLSVVITGLGECAGDA